MARKPPEDWITSTEAAEILTTRSDHPISADYVRVLGNHSKLTTWQVDKRTKLYLKRDVEAYQVKKRGTGEVRRRVRKKEYEAKEQKHKAKPQFEGRTIRNTRDVLVP